VPNLNVKLSHKTWGRNESERSTLLAHPDNLLWNIGLWSADSVSDATLTNTYTNTYANTNTNTYANSNTNTYANEERQARHCLRPRCTGGFCCDLFGSELVVQLESSTQHRGTRQLLHPLWHGLLSDAVEWKFQYGQH
jgi:hypothetical protein